MTWGVWDGTSSIKSTALSEGYKGASASSSILACVDYLINLEVDIGSIDDIIHFGSQ